MGGPTLLGLFGAISMSGSPKPRVLKPSGGTAARRRPASRSPRPRSAGGPALPGELGPTGAPAPVAAASSSWQIPSTGSGAGRPPREASATPPRISASPPTAAAVIARRGTPRRRTATARARGSYQRRRPRRPRDQRVEDDEGQRRADRRRARHREHRAQAGRVVGPARERRTGPTAATPAPTEMQLTAIDGSRL